jgi:hypothetical protein
MGSNPFDQFDAPRTANLDAANPFDQFDAKDEAKKDEPKGKPWYTPGDITKSAGIGLVQGGIGLASLPGNLQWLARNGVDKIAGTNYAETAPTLMPTYGDLKGKAEALTGEFYKPQSTAGEYARTAGEFAPGLIGGAAGLPARALAAGTGAVASETAGQATEGTAAEPWARMIAGILGSFAPSVGARMVTPAPVTDPRIARNVDILKGEGVKLTAGDKTGSKALRWAESAAEDSAFAGPGAREVREAQHASVTRAALKRIGEDSDDWTVALPRARKRIGAEFNSFAAKTPEIALDVPMFNDLNKAHARYNDLVSPSNRAPVVERILGDLKPAAKQLSDGAERVTIRGEQYSSWRSDLTDILGETTDENTRRAIGRIVEALDDAMERSAPAGAADAIAKARRQYRHLETLTGVASRAGQDTAQGYLSASNIRNAINANKTDKRYYSKGEGDFGEFARAAEAVIKPLPNSGTAPREASNNLMTLTGMGVGAALGLPLGAGGSAAGAMAGALAPVAGKALAARTVMSPLAQGYLGNQLIPFRGAPSAGVRATGVAGPAIMDDAEAEDAAKARWLAEALKNLR